MKSLATKEILVPPLNYAPPLRFGRLRRWIGPGSAGFFVLILALAGAGTWGAWKWRIKADERAFNARATIDSSRRWLVFAQPPDSASLRHLARLPGMWTVYVGSSGDSPASAARVLRGRRFPNVVGFGFSGTMDVDPWLIEMSRPDSGMNAVADLYLNNTKVTDAGLKELARRNSGLKSLASLHLTNTRVTDAGIKEFCRSDSGVPTLVSLNLAMTQVTDESLSELAKDYCGVKRLALLNVWRTRVTRAGIEALHKARPGLTIVR